MILHFEGKLLQSSGQDGGDRTGDITGVKSLSSPCCASLILFLSARLLARTLPARPSRTLPTPLSLPGICFRGCVAGPFRTVCAHREVLAYDRRVASQQPTARHINEVIPEMLTEIEAQASNPKPGRNVYGLHLARYPTFRDPARGDVDGWSTVGKRNDGVRLQIAPACSLSKTKSKPRANRLCPLGCYGW
jgi:hypothetical protein